MKKNIFIIPISYFGTFGALFFAASFALAVFLGPLAYWKEYSVEGVEIFFMTIGLGAFIPLVAMLLYYTLLWILNIDADAYHKNRS